MKVNGNPSKFLCERVTILPYHSYLLLNFNPLFYHIFPEKIRNLSFLNDTMNLTKPLSWNFLSLYIVDKERNQLHERKSYQKLILITINKDKQLQRLQYQETYIWHRNLYLPVYRYIYTHAFTCTSKIILTHVCS